MILTFIVYNIRKRRPYHPFLPRGATFEMACDIVYIIDCRTNHGLTYQAKLNCVQSEAIVNPVHCRASRGRSMKEMRYISKSGEPNPPLQFALAWFCLFPS